MSLMKKASPLARKMDGCIWPVDEMEWYLAEADLVVAQEFVEGATRNKEPFCCWAV